MIYKGFEIENNLHVRPPGVPLKEVGTKNIVVQFLRWYSIYRFSMLLNSILGAIIVSNQSDGTRRVQNEMKYMHIF